jgi:hypothetical protein
MNTQTRREIRFGLIALALSGLLFTLGAALRGPVDLADLGSYIIRAALSPNYAPGWAIILVGGVLQFHGSFGLYRYLTYQAENLIAFLAFVLRITGIALAFPLFTFLAVNAPAIAQLHQQGNREAIAVFEANFTSPLGLAILGLAGVANIIGVILFAIAIWRDGRLPKWTAILFVLGVLLQPFAEIFTIELLGLLLVLISTGMMAWKGWQESAVGAGQ